MGKNHYLIQAGAEFDEEKLDGLNIWRVGGSVCGAVCTVYLLGEYLNSGNPEDDSTRESELFDLCWDRINMGGAFSNPFKIAQYLKEQEEPKFSVYPKVEGELTTNPLYPIMKGALEDADTTFSKAFENPATPEEEQTYEHFLGVFADVTMLPPEARTPSGTPVPPGMGIPSEQYHYILLHRLEGGYEFINPHENRWLTKPGGKIESGFYVDDTWKWMNFGLYIRKN